MIEVLFFFVIVSFLIWLILLLLPDQRYLYKETLFPSANFFLDREFFPLVSIIIPARNEEAMLSKTLPCLFQQQYPNLEIILVDDQSTDQTNKIAQQIAQEISKKIEFQLISGKPLEPGWVGKIWALSQGIKRAKGEWLLFTDADIAHPPYIVAQLMQIANETKSSMVSLMAMLCTESFWEKLLIPAFLYFFKLLYPFQTVNNHKKKLAAAAGGCILIQRQALEQAGNIHAIQNAIIDDIALARMIKKAGNKILLLTAPHVLSKRSYKTLKEIWAMVSRSAFTELNYSYGKLALCVFLMFVVYAIPVVSLLAFFSFPYLSLFGFAAFLFMSLSYLPTICYFSLPWFLAFTLPFSAMLYLGMTLDSAWQYTRGIRSSWKDRKYQ